MTSENNQHCAYAVFTDGVREGIAYFRYRFDQSCAEMVNFEFTLPDGRQWRDGIPSRDVFDNRDDAEAEWRRRFG